jgi:hypothetical protein
VIKVVVVMNANKAGKVFVIRVSEEEKMESVMVLHNSDENATVHGSSASFRLFRFSLCYYCISFNTLQDIRINEERVILYTPFLAGHSLVS